MSWPCAQVSMIRAVSDDAALMAGPNQGSLALGSRTREGADQAARAVSNQASSWAPDRSRNRAAIVSGSTVLAGGGQRGCEARGVGRGLDGDLVEVGQVA